MEHFINKFNSLGYNLKIFNKCIFITSLKDDVEIQLRTVDNEVCIINFNRTYVSKFDIRLVSLISLFLIEYSFKKI